MVLIFFTHCTAQQDEDHVIVLNEHNDNELIVDSTRPLRPERVAKRVFPMSADE